MPSFLNKFALAVALAAAAVAPAVGQGYGPVVVKLEHYEMYRGDTLDLAIGKPFDWAEVEGEAVAAVMREDHALRLVAIKRGKAKVVLTDDEAVVWRAEVVVR